MTSKFPKPLEFQDAIEYNAADMMQMIKQFSTGVKGAHVRLLQTATEILVRKGVTRKHKIV
jgi:hypothetical protein